MDTSKISSKSNNIKAAPHLLASAMAGYDDDDPITSVADLLRLDNYYPTPTPSSTSKLSNNNDSNQQPPVPSTSTKSGSNDTIVTSEHCQVCDLMTEVRRQANDSNLASMAVCQACKKFFQRNRNRQVSSLRCLTGANNCPIGQGSAETIATGVVWRKVCPRCRLAKCNAIGMQNTYRDIWPTLAALPLRNPEMKECSAAESALRSTAAAASELAASFGTLPLKVTDRTFNSDVEAWRTTMEHFEYVTRHISTFVKAIPGYNDLPVKDRCALFGNSLLPIALAEGNRRSASPGLMSPNNAEQLYKYFPEYKYVSKEADHLWGLLQAWNPSLTEFSCLLAVLFYRSFYINDSSLHGSNGNIGGIADLELAIRALLMQQCSGDVASFNSRIHNLLNVSDNLRQTVVRRQSASAEVANRCPHLFQLNALHSAVYREYTKNNPTPPPSSTVSSASGDNSNSSTSLSFSNRPSTSSLSTMGNLRLSASSPPTTMAAPPPPPPPPSSSSYCVREKAAANIASTQQQRPDFPAMPIGPLLMRK